MIDQAFILAAGMGARMRPLTDVQPKPMVHVWGRPILYYALASLAAHGVKHCVINTHYKADQIEDYIAATRSQWPFTIDVVYEDVLLDTGGGLLNGMARLDRTRPAFVLAGDSIVCDAPDITSLHTLEQAWQPDVMDILLLLQPLASMHVTVAQGDYDIVAGLPVRSLDKSGAYPWTSARILHPRLFNAAYAVPHIPAAPYTPFSFLPLMDATEQAGRLGAVVHTGTWHHLTTPDDVARVNALVVRA